MAPKRKSHNGSPAKTGRQVASEPTTQELIEQRRRSVPEVPGWQDFIDAAQMDDDVTMADGRVLPRVRYGDEPGDWGADGHPCHDCRAVKGQYHVSSCGVERCPSCGGQFACCDCDLEDVVPVPAEKPKPKSRSRTAGGKSASTAANRKRKTTGKNTA